MAREAEKRARPLIGGATGGLDPVIRSTRTIEEYAPVFLRHHRVEGNAKDTYSGMLRLHVIPFPGKVRLSEMNRGAAGTTSRRWRSRGGRRTRSAQGGSYLC